MLRTASLALAAAALLLVLSGCSIGSAPGGGTGSGGGSTATGPSSVAGTTSTGGSTAGDACALLSLQDANAALQAAEHAKVDSASPGNGECDYKGATVAFFTTVEQGATAADWSAAGAAVKSDVGDAPAIPGLGDRAVGAIRLLAVQKGSTIIELNGTADPSGSPAQNMSTLALLARIMLQHVQG